MEDCFAHPDKIGEVNQTLIKLIPKCDVPCRVTQFRHIFLCNVVCNVVIKVITDRLRSIMPYIDYANQSSFVPNRSTCDNILVLQEVIHSLNHLHGKNGYMVIMVRKSL